MGRVGANKMNEIKYKQYVIVPKRPKMSKGKIASQVAHATFMALEKQLKFPNKHRQLYLKEEWKNSGMCVIVLECDDTEQLVNIASYLDQWKVPNHLYIDEGLTEIRPMTPTALATGVLDWTYFWMFSKLNLFKGK